MSTASSAEDSDVSGYSLPYASNKRKGAKVESTSAPKRRSQRIASQNSDLTVATSQLRLSSSLSSSYDLNNLASELTDTNSDTGSISDTDTNIKNINEANEKEKDWWLSKGSLGSLGIDEKRLPLVLARNVTFSQFAKRVNKTNDRRFLDYRNGTVTIIESPTGEHESAHDKLRYLFMNAVDSNTASQDGVDGWGAKSLYTNLPTKEYEEPDACFVPRRLLVSRNPAQNPCDLNGNPWPTIIFEIASSETLQHVKNKINNHWLASNRCEDVIVIKIGSWKRRRRNSTTGRPLRRLRCLKFCRTATLQQNPNATTFNEIQMIEFGSVHANGRESQFCNGPHMKWITIDCNCIFAGCPQPLPLFHSSRPFPQPPLQPQVPYPLQRPGIAIDLYDIQQAIFRAMGPI